LKVLAQTLVGQGQSKSDVFVAQEIDFFNFSPWVDSKWSWMVFWKFWLFKDEASVCYEFEALVDNEWKFHDLKLFDFLAGLDKALTALSGYHQHIEFVFFTFLPYVLTSPVLLVRALTQWLLKSSDIAEGGFPSLQGRTRAIISLASLVDEAGDLFEMVDEGVALNRCFLTCLITSSMLSCL
jgi:hypothetical protein